MPPLKTLLIVDDSAADTELLTDALELKYQGAPENLLVLTATDGDEGVAAIRKHKPSLVLLDLNMPRLSGISVLELIRADRRLDTIPVLVLSTSSGADDRKRSIRAGARAYLTKPSTFEGTCELVGAVLEFWTRAR